MKKEILVVDDDPDILDALEFTLLSEGYHVLTSETGDIADNEETLLEASPDLIILDILLSGKDGRAICRKIKSQPLTKHIPILMISAHISARQTVEDAGADDFLAKPFDVVDLLGKVKQYTHNYSSNTKNAHA